MKKFLNTIVSIITFATMIFTGLILAYSVAGWLYSVVMNNMSFNYSIPFIFVLEGTLLSVMISVLWTVFLTDSVFRKMRYYLRIILFVCTVTVVLSTCFLVFFKFHTDWAKLWLIISGLFVIAVIGTSVLGELYFQLTGKRYTQILNDFKENIL